MKTTNLPCYFPCFLHWRRNFDTAISMYDLCAHISQQKNCCIKNGKYMTDIPNYLFIMFSGLSVLAAILLEKVPTWYIILCSLLFASLIPELQIKIKIVGFNSRSYLTNYKTRTHIFSVYSKEFRK